MQLKHLLQLIRHQYPANNWQQLAAPTLIGSIFFSVGLLTFTSYRAMREVMLEDLQTQSLEKVQTVAEEIDDWLLTGVTQLETIATTPAVQSMDWSVAKFHLQRPLALRSRLSQVQLVKPDGSGALSTADPLSGNLLKRLDLQRMVPGSYYVSDPLTTNGGRSINIGVPIWSKGTTSERAVAPIQGTAGQQIPAKPIGAVVATVPFTNIAYAITNLATVTKSDAFIFDSQGRLITASRRRTSWQGNQSLSITETLSDKIAQRVLSRSKGVEPVYFDHAQGYTTHYQLKRVNWTIVLLTSSAQMEQNLPGLDLMAMNVGVLLMFTTILVIATVIRSQQTRHALQQSETRLRSYFNLPLVGIAINDRNKQWIDFNDQWCKMLGYTREELVQLNWQDFTHPDDLAIDLAQYARGTAGELDQYSLEKRYIRKDGTFLYANLSVGFIRCPNGKLECSVALIQDITPRKHAEAALAESNARLAYTQEFSLVMVTRVTLDGWFIKVPPTFCNWLGYSEATMLSSNIKDVSLPEDFETDWQQCQRLIRGEIKSFDMEKRLIRRDGTIVWAYLNCSIVLDAEGNPVEFLSYLRDVTDQKQAEEALRQSEARFRRVVESSVVGIYFARANGAIVQANDAFLNMMGYTRDDLEIGNLRWDSMTPSEYTVVSRRIARELQQFGASKTHEKEYIRADGSRVPVLLGVMVMEPGSQEEYRVTFVLDITQRKRSEKKLQASLHEKDVMLKEIHHRVKNNLQIITSLLKLQASYVEDEQVIDLLKESQSRVRAMALIHEKLYRSADLARTDFAQYIHDLAQDLFRSYGINPAVVSLQIRICSVLLSIDTAIPCGLIINELVSNALKYAFPGGRSGKISIHLGKGRQGNYVLRIIDDGVGIPDNIDFRDTPSLGLNLVCTLVSQLGGTIDLDRSMGGCDFKILFND